MVAVVIIAIVAVGYIVSTRIHPLRKCPTCSGTGRHFGSIYTSSGRNCRKCGGTGRYDRIGTRVFWGGTGSHGIFPGRTSAESGMLARLLEGWGTDAAAGLAGWLVGSRHAHLRDAWAADLYGDPERGRPPADQQLRLAAGFVVAAIRMRLQDLTNLAWRPVDVLLASSYGSRLAIPTPSAIAVVMVVHSSGLYGLVANAENLTCIATAPYLAVKGLRRYRHISPPKRQGKQKLPSDERPNQGSDR